MDDFSFYHDVTTPSLPHHLRCACHTLSLIVTCDVKKALSKSPACNRLHDSAMSKCSEYWSSSHRPKSAETVASVLGRQLPTPCVTRWSSLYHALVALLDNKAQLRTLSEKLDLTTFRDAELEFLEEYRDILYPIATGKEGPPLSLPFHSC